MANPTIHGSTLSTAGTFTRRRSPRIRLSLSSLPSVDGDFVQRFGKGHAIWTGRGVLQNTTEAGLNAALYAIQDKTNSEPSAYVDSDGTSYDNCVLLSYDAAGDIRKETADLWWIDVRWSIMQQSV